ncbi:hypothetical protein NPIL_549431, partial [Nephila pilipes]
PAPSIAMLLRRFQDKGLKGALRPRRTKSSD